MNSKIIFNFKTYPNISELCVLDLIFKFTFLKFISNL